MRWSRKSHRNPGARRQNEKRWPAAIAPTVPDSDFRRIGEAWNRAIDIGLVDESAKAQYHCTPDGKLLPFALDKTGQIVVDGEQLTPRVANRLRGEVPLLAQLVSLYRENHAARLRRRLDEVAADEVSLLREPSGPDLLLRVVPTAVHLVAWKAAEPLLPTGKGAEAAAIPFQRQQLD
ncbi:hypothetical protein Stsp01_66640 [Streptomyces sp. NBRC 13847]|uniref:hypothetical protein n=1 Tax=Streptomyces TaxID=1883 RepID=UPI0024A5852B|nr:hypothetical protein [Streptomyces sp. NBRC 13847]GLW19921.1 hypothetical protein Stsp01_66640 [Streptomyces sp. NBRC 13847]